MTDELAKTDELSNDILTELVLEGNLSTLKAAEKVEYYRQFCLRLQLDPATQPFQILKLNGKEVLYATRACAAQLNRRDGVSHTIISRETINDCYVVVARAYTATRQEESIGAVPIDTLKGEALCNAMMKAETKAKRRSTLDLCGLGLLDEEEVRSTAFGDHNSALESTDIGAMQAMIEQHNRAMEKATPNRQRELLGLRSELECRIRDLQMPATPQIEENATVGGNPVKTVEAVVLEKSKAAIDSIVHPKKEPVKREKPTPVVVEPEPATSANWQDVKCHIGFQGKASGKLTGLTMAEIFAPNRSPEFVEATIGFFKKNLGVLAAPNAQDKQVWEAAQAAHKAWQEARTPASTVTATTTTEAPQQPAKLQGWGAYIVNSKSLPFNGKKLGDLGGDEVVQLDEYLGKVDWENATLPQKALKANFAMMKAEEFPSTLPLAANEEPEHTASLKAMIETHKLNRNSFMSVCKKNGWIDSTAARIEDITEEEASQIIGEWGEVSTAVRADQP